MRKYQITLFLSASRAFGAAEEENDARINAGLPLARSRVVNATLRADDGSSDQGFKVLMIPTQGTEPVYHL